MFSVDARTYVRSRPLLPSSRPQYSRPSHILVRRHNYVAYWVRQRVDENDAPVICPVQLRRRLSQFQHDMASFGAAVGGGVVVQKYCPH